MLHCDFSFGGQAVSGRPLALRPRLATGVPFRAQFNRVPVPFPGPFSCISCIGRGASFLRAATLTGAVCCDAPHTNPRLDLVGREAQAAAQCPALGGAKRPLRDNEIGGRLDWRSQTQSRVSPTSKITSPERGVASRARALSADVCSTLPDAGIHALAVDTRQPSGGAIVTFVGTS